MISYQKNNRRKNMLYSIKIAILSMIILLAAGLTACADKSANAQIPSQEAADAQKNTDVYTQMQTKSGTEQAGTEQIDTERADTEKVSQEQANQEQSGTMQPTAMQPTAMQPETTASQTGTEQPTTAGSETANLQTSTEQTTTAGSETTNSQSGTEQPTAAQPETTASQPEATEAATTVQPQTAAQASITFRNEKLLNSHYEKHGIEMGFASAKDYERAAAAVVSNPEALHKKEAEDGDDVYYIESTNEFVIVSTDGYIRTYFNPDAGISYYNRQ